MIPKIRCLDLTSGQFKRIEYALSFFSTETPQSAFEEACRRGLTKAQLMLESFLEDLDVKENPKGAGAGLTCPYCESINPEYLELRDIGSVELKGGTESAGGRIRTDEAGNRPRADMSLRFFERTQGLRLDSFSQRIESAQ